MPKKSAKSHRLTEKQSARGAPSSGMTVLRSHGSDFDYTGADSRAVSTRGGRSSGSSSFWDRQTEHGSWSEDIEDAASRRVLEQWSIVERTLYNEDEQLPLGPSFDECQQWRSQLPHLRIIGRGVFDADEEGEEEKATSAGSKKSNFGFGKRNPRSAQRNDKGDELFTPQREFFSREASFLSSTQNHLQAKEEVLDHIVEYICKELAEIEAEKEAEDLSDNFDEFLKIAPAPIVTGKNPLVTNNFYHNVKNSSNKSTKKDSDRDKEEAKGSKRELQTGRNKLGTVFNERIIVSPVPFVATTRESFSTLRRTPIQFLGENVNIANNVRSGSRRENTRRKLSLTRKVPLMAAPHVQATWNSPVCPTIWPKNVKLTPIDTSRLPSSKRRPSKTAESVPMRRNRNSLSPISRSVQPTSPRNSIHDHNLFNGLEIRGSHIEALDSKVTRTKLIRPKQIEIQ